MSNLPKYIVKHDGDITNSYSVINGDKQLKIWLKDCSLSAGDIVYQISKLFVVQPFDPGLVLYLKAEHFGNTNVRGEK